MSGDARDWIGQWTLASGRTLTVLLGPPRAGARDLRFRWDSTAPLTDADRADLEARVLCDVAAAIRAHTGRGGSGFMPLPGGDVAVMRAHREGGAT